MAKEENYLGGRDVADIIESNSANRIGDRIRKIRMEKGLTQAELGERVGLNADRIQKYENGFRRPKADLLKQIADVLGVNTLALIDPITSDPICAMYALFELEDYYNLQVESANGLARMTLDDGGWLREYIEEWSKVKNRTDMELVVASSEEEKAEIIKSYHQWQWTFPQGIIDGVGKEIQKARIKKKIEELQEAYNQLNE